MKKLTYTQADKLTEAFNEAFKMKKVEGYAVLSSPSYSVYGVQIRLRCGTEMFIGHELTGRNSPGFIITFLALL